MVNTRRRSGESSHWEMVGKEEVMKLMAKMKNGKAMGLDDIMMEASR